MQNPTKKMISYQWGKYFPISRPLAGNETKSVIFLLAAALNLFRCRQRTFGSLENVCCCMVFVLILHEGHCTWSAKVSGRVNWSKIDRTEWFRRLLLASVFTLGESFANGRETFEKVWVCVLLQPHFWHINTDRRTPVKISLMKSAANIRMAE